MSWTWSRYDSCDRWKTSCWNKDDNDKLISVYFSLCVVIRYFEKTDHVLRAGNLCHNQVSDQKAVTVPIIIIITPFRKGKVADTSARNVWYAVVCPSSRWMCKFYALSNRCGQNKQLPWPTGKAHHWRPAGWVIDLQTPVARPTAVPN